VCRACARGDQTSFWKKIAQNVAQNRPKSPKIAQNVAQSVLENFFLEKLAPQNGYFCNLK
jgi:hypothetical protein